MVINTSEMVLTWASGRMTNFHLLPTFSSLEYMINIKFDMKTWKWV